MCSDLFIPQLPPISCTHEHLAQEVCKALPILIKVISVLILTIYLQNPAKLLISDSDMGTIVKSIFDNLRKVYGTPQKVLSQIIREHNKVGGIPASGTDRKHITYSTFYQQTSLTKETVSLLEKDKQSYTSQKI